MFTFLFLQMAAQQASKWHEKSYPHHEENRSMFGYKLNYLLANVLVTWNCALYCYICTLLDTINNMDAITFLDGWIYHFHFNHDSILNLDFFKIWISNCDKIVIRNHHTFWDSRRFALWQNHKCRFTFIKFSLNDLSHCIPCWSSIMHCKILFTRKIFNRQLVLGEEWS